MTNDGEQLQALDGVSEPFDQKHNSIFKPFKMLFAILFQAHSESLVMTVWNARNFAGVHLFICRIGSVYMS